MTPTSLFVAVGVACLVFVVVQQRAPRKAWYVFKPIPILLLLGGLFACGEPRDGTMRTLVAIGLAASVLGDEFLVDAEKGFLPGLVSFLAAHVAYVLAFARGFEGPVERVAFLALPYLAVGVVLCGILWAKLGSMRAPVLLYAAVLCAMCGAARARGAVDQSLLAPIGATLFLVSDSILAIDRFRWPFRLATPLLNGLYVIAQGFLTAAVWLPAQGRA